ncbi:unnamed protein product [Prunus armeniaca]|uniref:Uncharacterized protein n=1 Tax=Prunus armeniaca TaxID=36596 RepID=A0A6J5U156_PRUAR|nr:unnamed protein product [Prunus armeniaca]
MEGDDETSGPMMTTRSTPTALAVTTRSAADQSSAVSNSTSRPTRASTAAAPRSCG